MPRTALLLFLFVLPGFSQAVESCCRLRVQIRNASGAPVPAAAFSVESGAIHYQGRSAPDGTATVPIRAPGSYKLTVATTGFLPASQSFEIARDQVLEINMVLAEAVTRHETVTVEGQASEVAPESTATSATGAQLTSLPERISDVLSGLPLLPGVVRTPEGKLRISGSPEYRSTFLLNSVDVTDPATGSFGPGVPVDIVETLQVYKSPFLAEYGRFSAGVVAVTTRRGGDHWHYELNDPTPELRIRSGHIQGIRGFTPRFAATGPVLRDRLFFSGAGSFELRKRPVYPLPFPYNEEKSQSVNAYAQFDYVPSSVHLVTLSLHGVPQKANFRGLNFYTPQPTAPSWRAEDYRASISDRLQFESGTLLESTLSVSDNRGRVGGQGNEPLTLLPNSSEGNYPFRTDRTTRRAQWAEVATLRALRAAGRHTLKIGGALERAWMHGSVGAANDVRIAALDGTLLQTISFHNGPGFRLADTEAGLFVQDGWEPVRSVHVDFGIRSDWQALTGVNRFAPRAAAAWMPFAKLRTVIRAGLGWFYDRVPMAAYSWAAYPLRDGLANVLGVGSTGPLVVGSSEAGAFAPRSRTWSAGVDQPFNRVFTLHASWQESDSHGLLVVQPTEQSWELRGTGAARTRSVELIGKLSWYDEQQWVVSYVHTKARGNLNTFIDLGGTFLQPVIRLDVYADQPEVVPHRFITWGVFPLRYGLRFSPVVEWRNGFPYSALNELQEYAGVPNSLQMPSFFSLDARVAKDIAVRGHKVRLSFSMFNVTDHGNYDAVRLNVADPQFGEVLGRRPRRFRLDFDWLF